MNPVQLFAQFDRLSDAPDAIPRLRRFILELAVRGKLVEQDLRDEPASELVKRIQAGGTKLRKNSKIRKQEKLPPVDAGAIPFSIPTYWASLPLKEIGLLSGGMTPSMNRQEFWGGSINWFSPKDVKSDELVDSELKITATGVEETGLQLYPPGCLFMVARSGILKRTFPVSINRVEATANQDLKVLKPFVQGLERYLQIMFRGMTDVILSSLVKTGTTVQSLKYEEFEMQPFPLPPLAEQQRIVAKVDELMALCDRLEAAQAERESRRDRLVTSSLNRLNNNADADAFLDHARFYFNHLSRLTTCHEHIQQLRQAILNLAVRGRLVSQTPNDESADTLLTRLANRNLQDNARRRRSELLQVITTDEIPFELPIGWAWARLGNIGDTNIGLTYSPQDISDVGIPVLRSSNIQNGKLDYSDLVRVKCKPKQSVMVQDGDLLICARNGSRALVGKVAVIEDLKEPAAFGAFMAIFRSDVNQYLYHFIRSPLFRQMINEVNTTTINQITQNNLRSTLAPIPPLAEQHRIVAKVEELMALCDRLETQLTTTQTESRRLLEAVLHEALAPAV